MAETLKPNEFNPGSFNTYKETLDETISEADAVLLYSSALSAYRDSLGVTAECPKETLSYSIDATPRNNQDDIEYYSRAGRGR